MQCSGKVISLAVECAEVRRVGRVAAPVGAANNHSAIARNLLACYLRGLDRAKLKSSGALMKALRLPECLKSSGIGGKYDTIVCSRLCAQSAIKFVVQIVL